MIDDVVDKVVADCARHRANLEFEGFKVAPNE